MPQESLQISESIGTMKDTWAVKKDSALAGMITHTSQHAQSIHSSLLFPSLDFHAFLTTSIILPAALLKDFSEIYARENS